MEEQKKKVIEMQPSEKSEKLSYEQLENIAHQLSEQNQQLYMKLQSATMTNMFKRLDYLFKVLENSKHFNPEFIIKCSEEIEEIITVPEEKESEESEEKE